MGKEKIEGQDACVMMHTALRKCCDSKITTAAYNLIHIIDVEPASLNAWRILGDLVAEDVNKGMRGRAALERAAEKLDRVFHDEYARARDGDGARPPENAKSTMWALLSTLRCFDENDLEGMAAYLDEEG